MRKIIPLQESIKENRKEIIERAQYYIDQLEKEDLKKTYIKNTKQRKKRDLKELENETAI